MMLRHSIAVVALTGLCVAPAWAQQCVPGQTPTPEQQGRRRDAIRIARLLNTLETNQPGARSRMYLTQDDLHALLTSQPQTSGDPFVGTLDLRHGAELRAGWQLTLAVTERGYWFMITDKTDPCGFSLISNQDGVIFTAEPIR